MREDLIKKLTLLEFSEKEAKVYMALSEIGQTSAGEIIKATGFHRNVVYTALDKLINRKLAFRVTRKNIAFYQITNPAQLEENARKKLEVSSEVSKALSKYLDSTIPEIKIHEGVEVYKNFWFSAYKRLPKNSTDYVAGSIGEKWLDFFGERDNKKLQKLRVERGLVWQMVIFDKNDFELELTQKYPELNKYRLVDKKSAPKEGNFNIFNDEWVILHSAVEPMIIEIRSKSLAKVFKNIFDLLWEMGRELK